MVVNRKGKAVAVGTTGEPIIVEGVGSFVGIKAINACLKDIPVEAGETVHFYIPDVLQGVVGGAAIEYVKTGKTGTGTVLTAEEIEDFKVFYKLYAERILNVRFSLAKYAKDQSLIQLRTKAWNLLSSQTNTVATPTNTIIGPDKELREALGKKMLEAIDSGNMELYAILKGERDKLKAPEVVANSTKVEYDASKWEDKATYITPSSRNTVADTNTVVNDNDTNITEVPEEAEGNIAW